MLVFLWAKMASRAGGEGWRNGVVSTQHQGQESLGQRFVHALGNVLASLGNFLQVLCAFFADWHFFRLLHFEVADILDGVAQLLDRGLQSCAANRRRPHIHAAAAFAQVHGHTNDANFLWHMRKLRLATRDQRPEKPPASEGGRYEPGGATKRGLPADL